MASKLTKEELKKMRLANLKRAREDRAKRLKEKPLTEPSTKPAETPSEPSIPSAPPPLPPLTGPVAPPSGLTGAPVIPPPSAGPAFDDEKLRAGLGKAFGSLLKGTETVLNSVATRGGTLSYEIEKLDVSEEELFGTFALPVLKKRFPKFEESPEYALAFVVVAILAGRMKIKRSPTNARAENTQTPQN